MTIYESELENVKKRLEDIKNEKTRPGKKVFVIAAGDPVLEEYKDEYIALKRMKEILENNFQQSDDYEYLYARENTKLPELAAGIEEKLIHSNVQAEDQDFGPAPAPIPNPNHIMTQEEIKRMMSDYFQQQPVQEQQHVHAPASTPAEPVQQQEPNQEERQTNRQDNLIHLTPQQLENLVMLVTDAVTRALKQPNLGPKTQIPEPVEPEQQQEPDQASETPETPEDTVEQVPDLTDEELAAMSQSILHGTPDRIEDDEDLEPVVKVTKWQWIKNHKKPIFIALGITAMALTVAIGLPHLFPALKTAANSAQVANLAGQMAENSQLALMNAADHLSLHSANTALAEKITDISSIKNTYDAATGAWTFGTKGLQDFIAAQASKAAAAEKTVSTIKAAMKISGLTGFGLFGTGLIMPRAKSQEFKDIVKEIKEYPNDIEFTPNDELDDKHDDLVRKITESNTLKNWEKKKLLKKLKKLQKKVDFEIQYRDDPNFEEGMALGETLSEQEGRSL